MVENKAWFGLVCSHLGLFPGSQARKGKCFHRTEREFCRGEGFSLCCEGQRYVGVSYTSNVSSSSAGQLGAGQTSHPYFCWGCKRSRSLVQWLFVSCGSGAIFVGRASGGGGAAVPFFCCPQAVSTPGTFQTLWPLRWSRRMSAWLFCACPLSPAPNFLILPFILALCSACGTSPGCHWEV